MAKQIKRSESAHLVCLIPPGRRVEKIETTPDLPDRPNRLTETKSSHITNLVVSRRSPALSAGGQTIKSISKSLTDISLSSMLPLGSGAP